jgi:hypothetical protein
MESCFFSVPQLHRTRVNVEEMKSGKISNIPKDVSFKEAIEDYYPETRGEYIRSTTFRFVFHAHR